MNIKYKTGLEFFIDYILIDMRFVFGCMLIASGSVRIFDAFYILSVYKAQDYIAIISILWLIAGFLLLLSSRATFKHCYKTAIISTHSAIITLSVSAILCFVIANYTAGVTIILASCFFALSLGSKLYYKVGFGE